MKPFAELDIENNGNYLKLLSAVSKLSGLFSESSTPYIDYRIAENIFCNCFNAENLSRSDTAFDANFKSNGIGLKTFVCPADYKLEKIAEFNTLSSKLKFNFSKSTLFRRFDIPKKVYELPVDIIEDPYSLILDLFKEKTLKSANNKLICGRNYIVLPLYSTNKYGKYVSEKSGLNQWNAGGRLRDLGEIYIPIPIKIHQYCQDFFPDRDKSFELIIPTGETFSAKVCQQNNKALMTNPNNALSDWLLRKILQVKEGELLTIDKLNELGFDSVIIIKDGNNKYKIDKAKTDSYKKFIENICKPL